jgi:hypothetical protein
VSRRTAILLAMLLASWAAAGTGCSHPPVTSYLSSPAELHRINRVAFLELQDEALRPKVAQEVTEEVFRALQDRRIFRVELVRATDSRYPSTARPGARFSISELKQLRETLDCDAILTGSLSSFQQHPRMQIGLRLTLLSVRDGRVVWSVDSVWDTRDREVEKRIEDYFEHEMASKYEPVEWRFGTVSASAFEKFVAYEVAQTLPERPKR